LRGSCGGIGPVQSVSEGHTGHGTLDLHLLRIEIGFGNLVFRFGGFVTGKKDEADCAQDK